MENPGVPINTAPWSKFMEGLRKAGVKVSYTQSGMPFLHRMVGGKALTAALPSGFDEENPDKSGIVGCFVFDSICRKLDIPTHKYFEGWYFVL